MYKRIGYVNYEGTKYAIFENAEGHRICGRYINLAIFGKMMAWVIYGLNENDKSEPHFYKSIKSLNAAQELKASWL